MYIALESLLNHRCVIIIIIIIAINRWRYIRTLINTDLLISANNSTSPSLLTAASVHQTGLGQSLKIVIIK